MRNAFVGQPIFTPLKPLLIAVVASRHKFKCINFSMGIRELFSKFVHNAAPNCSAACSLATDLFYHFLFYALQSMQKSILPFALSNASFPSLIEK
jgi:hypothetical protein